MGQVKRRETGQAILASDRTDDQKLCEMFQLYKSELQVQYPNLYYALLGWRDAHIRELNTATAAETPANEYFK